MGCYCVADLMGCEFEWWSAAVVKVEGLQEVARVDMRRREGTESAKRFSLDSISLPS
jgi:hypothetical protein